MDIFGCPPPRDTGAPLGFALMQAIRLGLAAQGRGHLFLRHRPGIHSKPARPENKATPSPTNLPQVAA